MSRSFWSRNSAASVVMSRKITRKSGNIALASSSVYSLRFFGRGCLVFMTSPSGDGAPQSLQEVGAGAAGVGAAGAGAGGFGGGGGSGGFVHTGSATSFDAAIAVGFKVAWPQAISTGSFAKSTMQPSRV